MMNYIYASILFITIGPLYSLASELGQQHTTADSSAHASAIELPECFKDKLQDVQAQVDANKNSSASKYKAYQELLAPKSSEEKIARLIYAEASAANCHPQKSDMSGPADEKMTLQVMPIIAAVIQNRIRADDGRTDHVLFEKDQFASSLNHYTFPGDIHPRNLEFLCPDNKKLWQAAIAAARSPVPPEWQSANHYFLYEHAPNKWPAPGGQMLPEVDMKLSQPIHDCVHATYEKGWKVRAH